jgi:hypothetical protein
MAMAVITPLFRPHPPPGAWQLVDFPAGGRASGSGNWGSWAHTWPPQIVLSFEIDSLNMSKLKSCWEMLISG